MEMPSTDQIEAFLAEPRNVVVAGIRRDGRPHLSPNWFYWDGQRFYVSTTRSRVKYAIFRRDPRAQLLVDDPVGFRAVLVPATAEIREDIAAELPRFRAIREKHGLAVPDDEQHLRPWRRTGGCCWPSRPTGRPRAGRPGAWTDRRRVGQRHHYAADLRYLRQHRVPMMSFTLIGWILRRNSTAAGNHRLGTHAGGVAVIQTRQRESFRIPSS